jgi:hypothetical protein
VEGSTGEKGASPSDLDVVLDATLALSEAQMLAQIADETSLDGRTMGLLAFNGALLAADIGAKELLRSWWWTPIPFVAIATALCLVSTFAKDTDLGPSAFKFYSTYGGLPSTEAREQLLSDLHAASDENGRRAHQKSTLLRGALSVLLVGLVVAALLITLDQQGSVHRYAQDIAGSRSSPGSQRH